ncbi:hypothetical protein [Actinomadura alba]|uniref:TadE-like protein n=1 Tax=Actinomadura alba TaxID=406431 RepID=A0ABR7LQX7_9ACTN|nr:hypothetical protein [Actinomadura alba]MBC6467073.1 hypothetical protein [Actinomadura alba]
MKRSDSGQFEFVTMLPFLVPLVLLVWEGYLIGMSMTYAGHGANEGARVAALGGSREDVEKAAVALASGVWADKKHVTVDFPSDRNDPDYGYVEVKINPPFVFRGLVLPMTISARSRVVSEEVE